MDSVSAPKWLVTSNVHHSPIPCNMYTASTMACLLDLLALLCELPLTSLLGSLRSGLSIHHIIPPSEAACIVANEALVVNVVVISTGPEGKEVMQAPWKLVTTVSINGLKETEDNPEIHCQDVKLASAQNPNDGNNNSAKSENHDFNGGRILGGQPEWSRVLVVNLVNAPVKRTPVHCAM